MLDIPQIAALAAAAAGKWIAIDRVLVEPMIDSHGEEALRVTLVLDPEEVERVTGNQALDVLVDINEALQTAGDERQPIIFYATDRELRADVPR